MRCIELTFVVPFPCRTSALCRCLREICITPFWLAVSEHRFTTTTTTTTPANAWISMSNDELMIWYDRIQYNRLCWLWCNFSSILKNPCIHCFDAYRYDWFQWFCVILSVARASNSMSLLRLFSISFFSIPCLLSLILCSSVNSLYWPCICSACLLHSRFKSGHLNFLSFWIVVRRI